jgi:hypothetical protein
MRIHTAAKATNTYHDVTAKVLATQTWWFLSLTPDSMQKSWVSMSEQFYERAKSTALLLRLPAQRRKELISAMISLPKSWMPIRNGSYSRNLFQAMQRQKKIWRSENFRFSSASAENSAVDIKYRMESTAWKAADALRRLAQIHVGVSGSMRTSGNSTII